MPMKVFAHLNSNFFLADSTINQWQKKHSELADDFKQYELINEHTNKELRGKISSLEQILRVKEI